MDSMITIARNEDVALLAEGVDRNMYPLAKATRPLVSPSSRRAWIEIYYH